MAGPLCPKCSSPDLWDETKSKYWNNGIDKKTGKPQPRWKCKDKNCGGKIYEAAGASGAAGTTGGASSGATAGVGQSAARDLSAPATALPPAPNGKPSHELYQKITAWVLREIVPMYEAGGVPMTPEAVTSCVHTLFINKNRNA